MSDNKNNSKMNVLDEQLNATEIGQFVAQNKTLVIGLIVLILVGVVGYGIAKSVTAKKHEKLSQVIYDFEQESLKALEEEKIDAEEYLSRFSKLMDKTGSYQGTLAISIQTADLLIKRGELAKAQKILEESEKEISSSNPFVGWFIYNRLAVVYEDMNNDEMAIEYLKKMNGSKVKLLEPKVYLDLGRLYLKAGKKEDASINLKYVVDNFEDSSFAKVAKLYLSEIK